MTTIIRSHKDAGPYFKDDRSAAVVESVPDFITKIRSHFQDRVDAILVTQDDKVTGLWLREPDVDCDCDGYFEIEGRYPGDEYVLYRPEDLGIWNYVAYHFGHKFVPEQRGFIAEKHPRLIAYS